MGLFDKLTGNDDDKDEKSAAEKKMADFSDVNASSSSVAADSTRTYTVEAGDSLSKIAKREYGDASKWQKIYAANQGVISNPDLIHPGQVLTIPNDV